MKRTLNLFIFTFLWSTTLLAQQYVISGKVSDRKGEPLVGVNIYLLDTYDGTTSSPDGTFRLVTIEKGFQVLVASFIGYQKWEKALEVVGDLEVTAELVESSQALDAVTITAGSFEASDKKRAAVLEPLDIYTTAGALGDINGALKTLPGTQPAAEDGRLLVRGGEAYESKTFIDGLLAGKPYFSKVPDVPTRGRFAPSLFSGTMFNTGGYSAEYGQALSSVLVLNSNDLATEDITSVSLMSVGMEIGNTKRWKNRSLMVSGSYTNLQPFFSLIKTRNDWEKPVEAYAGTMVFRQKVKENGLFKAYVTTDWGEQIFKTESGTPNRKTRIDNRGGTTYANFSYKDCLSEKSCWRTGFAITYDNNRLLLDRMAVNTVETNVEGRLAVVHDLGDGIKMTYGISDSYTDYSQDYFQPTDGSYYMDFKDHIAGAFVEPEIKFSKYFGIRPGIRAEYSSLLNRWSVAPRLAMAYKTGAKSQISISYGQFFQNPENDVLKFADNIDFEKASHYILSFQSGSNKERLFRLEGYVKKYDQLVRFSRRDFTNPALYANYGDGYAGGIDLFFRDRRSLKNLDYWIAYSYIDTKRLYKDFQSKVTPDFVSDHSGSVVAKYGISKLNCQLGATWTFASGRPFNDPNSSEFMGGKTTSYSDLSMNLSYLTHVWDHFTVIYCSVTNVFGHDNLFGYRTTQSPNSEGVYPMIPIRQDINRFFFVGMFISIN